VVIAGMIIRAWPLLILQIEAQMRRGLHELTFERTQIVPTSLQEKASLVGAIPLGIAQCFGLPAYL
jgi:hypothetical protein